VSDIKELLETEAAPIVVERLGRSIANISPVRCE